MPWIISWYLRYLLLWYTKIMINGYPACRYLLCSAGVTAKHSIWSAISLPTVIMRKSYLSFLFFSPPLPSLVIVSMGKDGEHDKTQMVNKYTFNNNNSNNDSNNNDYYFDDDDDDDGNFSIHDLPMSPVLFQHWSICLETCIACSASYLLMHANVLIWSFKSA